MVGDLLVGAGDLETGLEETFGATFGAGLALTLLGAATGAFFWGESDSSLGFLESLFAALMLLD